MRCSRPAPGLCHVVVALAVLGACSSCSKVSAPGSPGAAVPEARRQAIVQAAIAGLDTLALVDPAHAISRTLAAFSSIPEIRSSGSSTDGGGYAIFRDGVVWLIANLQDRADPDSSLIQPSPRIPPAQSGQYAVPPPAQVHLFNAMGPFFQTSSYTISIRARFAGYPLVNVDTSWSPQSLKDLGAYPRKLGGVVQFCGHGGWAGPSIPAPYAVWTSQNVSPEWNAHYKEDMDSLRIVIMSGAYIPAIQARGFHAGTPAVVVTRYAITSRFIDKYLKFDPAGTLVLVDACNSFSAPEFQNAFLGAGATAYLGWNNFASSRDAAVASDTLLAEALSSHITSDPGSPPRNRPFNIRAVYDSLRGLGELKSVAFMVGGPVFATLMLAPDQHSEPPGGGASGFWLAPSINALEFLPGRPSRFFLQGDFGGADTGHVTVDGVPVPFTRWDVGAPTGEYRIECPIPESGPGSSGNVQVWVHGIKSNRVPITEWRGTVTYTQPLGSGGFGQLTWNLHIRGSVQPWRSQPDQEPFYKESNANVMSDTRCSYSVYGGSSGNGFTVAFSGGGELPRADSVRAAGPHFYSRAYWSSEGFGLSNHRLVVEVGDFKAIGFRTQTFAQGSQTDTVQLVLGAGVLRMQLDPLTYSVLPNSTQLANLSWTAMPAIHPPTPNTPAAPGLPTWAGFAARVRTGNSSQTLDMRLNRNYHPGVP